MAFDIVGNLWQLTVMVKVKPGEPKMSNITNFFFGAAGIQNILNFLFVLKYFRK